MVPGWIAAACTPFFHKSLSRTGDPYVYNASAWTPGRVRANIDSGNHIHQFFMLNWLGGPISDLLAMYGRIRYRTSEVSEKYLLALTHAFQSPFSSVTTLLDYCVYVSSSCATVAFNRVRKLHGFIRTYGKRVSTHVTS